MSAATAAAHPFLNGVGISYTRDHTDEADIQASKQLFCDMYLAEAGNSEGRVAASNEDLPLPAYLDQTESAENQLRDYLSDEFNEEQQPNSEKEFISHFMSSFNPVKVLGQGGYGCVFAAERSIDDIVQYTRAVKRIPVLQGTKELALKEVAALQSLENPGIVRFYGAWKEEPPAEWQRMEDSKLSQKLNFTHFNSYKGDCAFLYIEMELCESTLTQWLSENIIRDIDMMILWFKQMVSAVRYIHDNGYIHRDLKPSNILFKDGRLKICDLGIVTDRATMPADGGQEVSMSRTAGVGTHLYIAPEQKSWAGRYSSKVDIFSLGLILTELCVVMTGDRMAEVFDNYRQGKPTSVLDHLPELKVFVAGMTNVTDIERPDCRQILAHPFLSYAELAAFRAKRLRLG